MKKISLCVAACAMAGSMMAQDSGFSAGLDLAMPMGDMGDFFSFGVGPMVSYENEAGDAGLLGGSIAYTIMFPKEEGIDGGSVLPIQAHYRHFFSDIREGFFAGAMVGYGMMTVKTEEFTVLGVTYGGSETEAGFALAPWLGYYVTEQIDLSLRYQMVMLSEDGDATVESGESSNTMSYIGLRAAYNF